MKIVAALCFASLVAYAAAQDNSFQGEFGDSLLSGGYGGSLFICIDDDDVHGQYSEFGIILGKLSDDGSRASGQWHEGGTGGCLSGDFEFELTSTGFTGYWSCKGDPDNRYKWEQDKLNSGRPQDLQCARLNRNAKVEEGSYSHPDYNYLHMCVDDEDMTASYEYILDPAYYDGDTDFEGYEKAQVAANGAILHGIFCEEDGSCGPSVWYRLKETNEVVNNWWYYQETYEDDGRIVLTFPTDPSFHAIDVSFNRNGGASDSECAQNDEISPYNGSFYTVDKYSAPQFATVPSLSSFGSGSSTASALAPALALMFVVVAAILM